MDRRNFRQVVSVSLPILLTPRALVLAQDGAGQERSISQATVPLEACRAVLRLALVPSLAGRNSRGII